MTLNLEKCEREEVRYAAQVFVDIMESRGYVFDPNINEKLHGSLKRISLRIYPDAISLGYPEIPRAIMFSIYTDDHFKYETKKVMIISESKIFYMDFPEKDEDYFAIVDTVLDPKFNEMVEEEKKKFNEMVEEEKKK